MGGWEVDVASTFSATLKCQSFPSHPARTHARTHAPHPGLLKKLNEATSDEYVKMAATANGLNSDMSELRQKCERQPRVHVDLHCYCSVQLEADAAESF